MTDASTRHYPPPFRIQVHAALQAHQAQSQPGNSTCGDLVNCRQKVVVRTVHILKGTWARIKKESLRHQQLFEQRCLDAWAGEMLRLQSPSYAICLRCLKYVFWFVNKGCYYLHSLAMNRSVLTVIGRKKMYPLKFSYLVQPRHVNSLSAYIFTVCVFFVHTVYIILLLSF